MYPSQEQETIIVPSRLNCTALTGSECACNTRNIRPENASMSELVFSLIQESERTLLHIPHPYRFVHPAARDQVSSRTPGDAEYRGQVTLQDSRRSFALLCARIWTCRRLEDMRRDLPYPHAAVV
jgi:hypothetical protein